MSPPPIARSPIGFYEFSVEIPPSPATLPPVGSPPSAPSAAPRTGFRGIPTGKSDLFFSTHHCSPLLSTCSAPPLSGPWSQLVRVLLPCLCVLLYSQAFLSGFLFFARRECLLPPVQPLRHRSLTCPGESSHRPTSGIHLYVSFFSWVRLLRHGPSLNLVLLTFR